MTDPDRTANNSNLMRQVVVAWVVAAWVVAIGVFLLALHEPGGDEPSVLRRYERPVVGIKSWDDDVSVRHEAGWVLQQSGSSTAPDAAPGDQ